MQAVMSLLRKHYDIIAEASIIVFVLPQKAKQKRLRFCETRNLKLSSLDEYIKSRLLPRCELKMLIENRIREETKLNQLFVLNFYTK